MALIAETVLNTYEFGFETVQSLSNLSIPCRVLCYNPATTKVDFFPLKRVYLEARKTSYLISTFKLNRIVMTPDQLVYCNDGWVLPENLVVGGTVWINHARSIVSDIITEIKIQRKPTRGYVVEIEGDLPFFANMILVKEQLELSDDTNK
jgi:hypothetical protein